MKYMIILLTLLTAATGFFAGHVVAQRKTMAIAGNFYAWRIAVAKSLDEAASSKRAADEFANQAADRLRECEANISAAGQIRREVENVELLARYWWAGYDKEHRLRLQCQGGK